MKKSFGFYGIVNPDVLALEGEYGPSLCNLPENERRTVAADLLLDDPGTIAHCNRERTVVIAISQLSESHRLSAVRAIINTL